jgi:excisionase family DNA binding protein
MSTIPDIFSTKELAELLGCSEFTIGERARKGDLPGLKFGDGGWVFPRGALIHTLNELAMQSAGERRAPQKPTAVAVPIGRHRNELPTLPPVPL